MGKRRYLHYLTAFTVVVIARLQWAEAFLHGTPQLRCPAFTFRRDKSSKPIRIKREDLPEETRRQLVEADQRTKELEIEYWRSLDSRELTIARKHASGQEFLKMGQLEQAVEDYQTAKDYSTGETYTWPLSLGLFYLGQYAEAASQLESDIVLFERKFEDSATDERIWRAAALMHLARKAGEPVNAVAESLPPLDIKEPGVLRNTVYELFRGRALPKDIEDLMAGITGFDILGTRFYGQFFLGLWYDACGEEAKSRVCIEEASLSTYANPDDLWHHIPKIHQKARGWVI